MLFLRGISEGLELLRVSIAISDYTLKPNYFSCHQPNILQVLNNSRF